MKLEIVLTSVQQEAASSLLETLAGSDSALKDADQPKADAHCKTGPAIHLPMVVGPIAVVTNVSNAASNKQDPRSWRLSVDVTRDGDQIKLSKVEFVP